MYQRYIAVENIVRKGEIACNKQFLLFSQCFLLYMILFFLIKCDLTLSQTSLGFYVSAVERLLKTLWEKEKLLVTSNFCFSRSVFFQFGELSAIIIKFEIAVCKLFQFGSV